MLLPIKDKEVKPEVSNTILLMSGKELLTEMEKKKIHNSLWSGNQKLF